ncbi:MAG: hypothetical protein ACRDSF_00550 [Pseudonocardiaceae bacterium]
MSEILEGDLVVDWRGPVVTRAPRTTRISLALIQQSDPRSLVVTGNTIAIADQVVYRVTGWDAHGSALLCELSEDRRAQR